MQNGQTAAEIQEEVALTNLSSGATASKRHSATDKMHFPRSNLQTITMLGTLGSSFACPCASVLCFVSASLVLWLISRDPGFPFPNEKQSNCGFPPF